MDSRYDPLSVEQEILNFWAKKKTFKKLVKQLSSSNKKFSFQDGPITANNPMGVHHAWGRTYKDVFQRFKAMQGYNQRWQNGFDCQGLWIEREEEKDHGFKTKEDIENFGLENWADACKARVQKFTKLITEDSIRLGIWMDWGNDYLTMTDNNNLHNWYLLKKYYEKKWLYKGKDVVPWCPRCGTASSKHDIITEGYKEVTHKAVFMKFPIIGKENEYLLIFTTTPWTVPANVAVAVNPEINYVNVKIGKEHYWIAESRTSEIKTAYQITNKLNGSDLVGVKYTMPYADLPEQKNAPHVVVAWNMASGEEGTGMVHIAPGCGPEDYVLGKREGLPAISPLNEAGKYKNGWSWLSGKYASSANAEIIDDMQKKGFIFKVEPYTHRYPHCWRCSSELIFRLVDEWYIKCDEIREKLIEANRKIKWYPEYGKQRQEDWFNNMGDWLISRKRYWGLPLPIWECKCGHTEVIGSMEELKQKASSGMKQLKELHRPWIDNVKLKCSKCGKEMSRVADVGDAWLDAGIVSFSTIGPYLTNRKNWESWYPPDFISENMPGQYRGWFNALFWASGTLTGKIPFKSIFGYESVKDDKGNEMHKSKGNAIWAKDALEKLGADPMRWRFCLQDPAVELWFGWNTCNEAKNTLTILWNLAKYLQINFDNKFKPHEVTAKTITDEWILSKLETLKKNVTENLDGLMPHKVVAELQKFIVDDFSRGYIHFIRDAINSDDKENIVNILYKILFDVLKLSAPIIPFVTEKIYQEIFEKYEKTESIHLLSWPEVNKNMINAKLEKDIVIVNEMISGILAAREKIKRNVRWPIKEISILSGNKDITRIAKEYENLIRNITNVLDISTPKEIEGSKREVRTDFKKLEEKFGKDTPEIIAKLTILSPEALMKNIEREGKHSIKYGKGKEAEITKDDLLITATLPENIILHGLPEYELYIHTDETKEMIASGFVRESIRAIQDLRKKAGLQKKDKISLTISADKSVQDMLKSNLAEIKLIVGSSSIKFGSVAGAKLQNKLKIRERDVYFSI